MRDTTGSSTTADSSTTDLAPNHHADHPGFAGFRGAQKALLFAAAGRTNARVIADLTSVGTDDHVVDIGCGPGNAVRAAARRGARATGVDPAPVMLQVARLLTRPGRRIAWVEGAAEAIPVPDGDATVVWSLLCVHHWADIDAGLAEVRRVLTSGGRLLAVERRTVAGATGTASHGWIPDQADAFADRCRAAGFTDVTAREDEAGKTALLVVEATRP